MPQKQTRSRYRRSLPSGATCLLALVLTWKSSYVQGKGYLYTPAARNVVSFGAYKAPWEADSFDGGGAAFDESIGHGLCGGISNSSVKTMLESGNWVSPIQDTFIPGGTFTTHIIVTEHNGGHLEMRLCELDSSSSNVTTQECLNTHVLEFVESSLDPYLGDMPYGLSSPADYASLPNNQSCDAMPSNGPVGLCCNNGGTCTTINDNLNRWVLPNPNSLGPANSSFYTISWTIPAGVTCEHCVLQMAIVDAVVDGDFPSATYNCADIAIRSATSEIETSTQKEKLKRIIIGSIVGGVVFLAFVILVWFHHGLERKNSTWYQSGTTPSKESGTRGTQTGSFFSDPSPGISGAPVGLVHLDAPPTTNTSLPAHFSAAFMRGMQNLRLPLFNERTSNPIGPNHRPPSPPMPQSAQISQFPSFSEVNYHDQPREAADVSPVMPPPPATGFAGATGRLSARFFHRRSAQRPPETEIKTVDPHRFSIDSDDV